MSVNAASLLYIREVRSSNPTRAISKLLSSSFSLFYYKLHLFRFYKQSISFVKKKPDKDSNLGPLGYERNTPTAALSSQNNLKLKN